jgi:aspartate kinase
VVPRQGYCQVHVCDLPEPLIENRLQVLQAVADEGISIDFLKLTPHGLSFVATADRAEDLNRVFSAGGYQATVGVGRTILSVHAVNIRDEEGLIAEVLREAIALGAQIDHVGDGHDRLLLVVGDADASRIQKHFESKIR